MKKIIKFFIEKWYYGLIESSLISVLWVFYPTLNDPLSRKTFLLSMFLAFYLPGYLGLYGLYLKIRDIFE